MLRIRVVTACLLVFGIGGLINADDDGSVGGGITPQPLPSINYASGYPKPGSTHGDLSVIVEWSNCTGVVRVLSTLYRNEDIQGKLTKVVACSTGKQVSFPTSSWTFTESKQTTGNVIVEGKAEAFDGLGTNAKVLASSNPTLDVTVP